MCVAGWQLVGGSARPLHLRDRVDPGHSAPDADRRAQDQVRVWTSAQRTDRTETFLIISRTSLPVLLVWRPRGCEMRPCKLVRDKAVMMYRRYKKETSTIGTEGTGTGYGTLCYGTGILHGESASREVFFTLESWLPHVKSEIILESNSVQVFTKIPRMDSQLMKI